MLVIHPVSWEFIMAGELKSQQMDDPIGEVTQPNMKNCCCSDHRSVLAIHQIIVSLHVSVNHVPGAGIGGVPSISWITQIYRSWYRKGSQVVS